MRKALLLIAGAVLGFILIPTAASGQGNGPDRPLAFEQVSPCRLVDTRASSAFVAAETRGFIIRESCGIPFTAEAVDFTITAVEPAGKGFVRMWPGFEVEPSATVLNFDTTLNATNSVAVGITQGAEFDYKIKVYGSAADIVIDVTGYYAENKDVAALKADVAALQAEMAEMKALLAGVTRGNNADGFDTLTLEGMNLQVTNGTGNTGATNGLGNVIIGYNTDAEADDLRSGSHYLVIGDEHSYSSYSAAVAGFDNASLSFYASAFGRQAIAEGQWSFVAGGNDNQASGTASFVGGGLENQASGNYSSVFGGSSNEASGPWSSAAGFGNLASGEVSFVGGASVSTAEGNTSFVGGGTQNLASGASSFVGGGSTNLASGAESFVGGGDGNIADDFDAFVGGGSLNRASSNDAFVGGGRNNVANGLGAFIGGGDNNATGNTYAFVGGGFGNIANGSSSFVGGGTSNRATGFASFVGGGQQNIAGSNFSAAIAGLENTIVAGSPMSVILGGFQDFTGEGLWCYQLAGGVDNC